MMNIANTCAEWFMTNPGAYYSILLAGVSVGILIALMGVAAYKVRQENLKNL